MSQPEGVSVPTAPRPAYWDERSVEIRLSKNYWVDPHGEWQGILSSDLIEYYNSVIGEPGMIDPFVPERLKTASYELTLGPYCLVDGVERTLREDDPWLSIPPNSIVFVSMAERLLLPHYIAARFDLAIEFIYKGLLLGTGPQVDPGFQGVLSTPLHNISSEPVHIRFGYPFAKIDFAKTSGLHDVPEAAALETEKDLYSARLRAEHGGSVRLFRTANRWREPIFSSAYAGERRVKSSLSDLEADIDDFGTRVAQSEDEVRSIRRLGLVGAVAVVIAVVAVLVTLAELDRSYTDSRYNDLQRQQAQESSTGADLRKELQETKDSLADVQRRVDALERRVAARR